MNGESFYFRDSNLLIQNFLLTLETSQPIVCSCDFKSFLVFVQCTVLLFFGDLHLMLLAIKIYLHLETLQHIY